MTKKNSISQFKRPEPAGILPTEPVDQPKTAPVATLVKSQSSKKQKPLGRKQKAEKERLSYTLSLRFTEEEGKLIEEKAGMVSVSKLLRHILQTQTDLFK